LQALIVGRPSDSTEMKAIIQEIFENEGTQVSENVNDIDIVVDDEWIQKLPLSKKASTIKESSPFTKVFEQIELSSHEGVSETLNILCNKEYITFLQYHFMPYIFIWSGFVYREMDGTQITRLSQGVIEKHFGTKRREIPKPVVPARHILSSLKTAIADCAKYESTNGMSVDKPLDTEQSVTSAFDVWRTKRNRREAKLNVANKLLKKSHEIKKKKSKWSYQKSQVTLKNVDKALSQASSSSQLLTKQEPSSPPTKAANNDVLNQLLKLRPKKQQPNTASALKTASQTAPQPAALLIPPTSSPVIDLTTSPKKPTKWYCELCSKQCSSSASFYQHKKSKAHLTNQ